MSGPQSTESPTSAADRERLRLTFGYDAARYDRIRPGYPAALFDDLAALACIGPGCRVLEIGVGTGQASVPLVERGCRLVGVEISPQLAALAQRKLARFANASVVAAAFEDWPLPTEPFDTVVSATAFHWIDPTVRLVKAADALRNDGALVTLDTQHIAGGTTQFFTDVQRCYERWDPSTPRGLRLPRSADIASSSEELDRSGRFGPAVFRRYEWEVTYPTDEYRDLLLTYSGHIALERNAQAGLLACITDLIDGRFGGRISKRYLTELRVARTRG